MKGLYFRIIKFFDSLKSLLLCFFVHMSKKVDFMEKIKQFFPHVRKGGKKLLERVKNFFMKKYGPSPFQRRIARISARFSHFLKQFQSLT